MPANLRPARPRDDLPSVARLLTLSDNVVAFALTLLVLQLRVPAAAQVAHPGSAADLAAQLAKEADQLISYVIAFYVIAQFWLAHHRVFRRVAGHHEGLAWWNFAFLFTITAMPFTSSLLGEYGNNPLAVDIFAVNVLLATLATQATLLFGQRRDVLIAPPDAAEVRARRARVTVVMIAMALSIGLAWVNTSAAKYCWLLIPLAPWAANRWAARTHLRPGRGRPGWPVAFPPAPASAPGQHHDRCAGRSRTRSCQGKKPPQNQLCAARRGSDPAALTEGRPIYKSRARPALGTGNPRQGKRLVAVRPNAS